MSITLICVLVGFYFMLGVIGFVCEIATITNDTRGNWEAWQIVILFFATLLFGGAALILAGISRLPWACGFVCGFLVAQFKAGWNKASQFNN